MIKKRKFLGRREKTVLLFLLMNIFISPLISAPPVPDFYDDFSDGKFYNRTATDPWGRAFPEWMNPYSDSQGGPISESYFDADKGYLNMHTLNKYYSHIETEFTITDSNFFKLEYDYRSLTDINDVSCSGGVNISGPAGGYYYRRLKDGHAWLTLGGWHLAGWNAPIYVSPSGVAIYMGNEWHHVEIYRLPTHEIVILEDGLLAAGGDWSTSFGVPIGIGTTDVGESNNWEIWDNPALYRPLGKENINVVGGFNKIQLTWYNGMVAVDNIKLWTYDSTDSNTHYNDILIPGTGAVAGQVKRSDYPPADWRAVVTDALVTDGTRVSYSVGNGAGKYSIINVPPGTYTLRASRRDFTSTTQTVTVEAGKTTYVTPILTPSSGIVLGTGTINGTVKDSNGNPLSGVTVDVGEYRTTTGSDGSYMVSGVTEGRFCVLFGKAGYKSHTEIVDLVAGTRKVIDVVFTTNSGGDITSPIISANSPAGTGVEVNTPITVTFSEIMNKTSVENVFSISPAVSGSFTWSENRLIFTPVVNLADSTTYTVKISTGAQDVAGNNLAALYTWSFTTVIPSPDLPEVKDKKEVLVYPNPYVKGKSNGEKITFGNLPREAAIKIYNSVGVLVKELLVGAADKVDWDIKDIRSGIYLYVVSSPAGVKKGKVSVIK